LIEKGTLGLYVSVNPYNPETMEISAIERLYFDFDCKERVLNALHDTRDFNKKLVKYYGVSPFICYSGSKGYAVYVFLQEPVIGLERELKPLYERLQNTLVGNDKYRWLDPQPLGDLKRVSRVPFSIHQKSGDLCTPVDVSETPPIRYKPEKGFTETHRKYGLKQVVVESVKQDLNQSNQTRRKHKSLTRIRGNVRPCLAEVMESSTFPEVKRGYDGHNLLIAAVIEYVNSGYTQDEVLQLLEKKQGYDEDKSKHLVKYVINKYEPRKCKTIQSYGGCTSSVCPFSKIKNTLTTQKRYN
jgi:hypothetical protein